MENANKRLHRIVRHMLQRRHVILVKMALD